MKQFIETPEEKLVFVKVRDTLSRYTVLTEFQNNSVRTV